MLPFLLGFISSISQVILLRELVVVFLGNEIAYAVVLSAWLFWVGIGCLVYDYLIRKIPIHYLFKGSLFLIAVFVPLSIFMVRYIKLIIGWRSGEITGIIPIIGISFLVLSILPLLLGGFYIIFCHKQSSNSVRQIYLWEALGAAVGGILVSFLLINFLSHIQIVFIISFLVFVLWILCFKNILKWAAIGILTGILLLSFSHFQKIDHFWHSLQWKPFKVLQNKDSKYGNVTITQQGSTFGVFENGLLSFSTGDALTAEETVHFTMLQNPEAKHVLLIGSGLSGTLKELLKYPYSQVDYVELDSSIIEICRQNLPFDETDVLQNPRIKLILEDPRRYVKISSQKYDIVILSAGDPLTALINRYYTKEFFEELKKILNPSAVFSFSISSSENYISSENRRLLSVIYSTLKKVFQDIQLIPGSQVIFLASSEKSRIDLNSFVLSERIKHYQISNKYVVPELLSFRLDSERLSKIKLNLNEHERINSDFFPSAYLYGITFLSTHFNNDLSKILESLKKITFIGILTLLCGFFIILFVLRRRSNRFPLYFSIFSTGFSQIVFQVLVILGFQTLYGYAYYRIGLIISSFMLGLVFGSWYSKKWFKSDDNKINPDNFNKLYSIYVFNQFFIVLYFLLLPFIFKVFHDNLFMLLQGNIISILFTILPIFIGFIGGLQYPLALLLSESEQHQKSAGFLYSWDTLGASVGSLLTASLLIPLLGMNNTIVFCGFINFSALILLLIKRRGYYEPSRTP